MTILIDCANAAPFGKLRSRLPCDLLGIEIVPNGVEAEFAEIYLACAKVGQSIVTDFHVVFVFTTS